MAKIMAALMILVMLTGWSPNEYLNASTNPHLAAVAVCGAIASDTTWTAAASPYDVCATGLTVNAGVTLTIQPGVTVTFENGGLGNTLHVAGTLIAAGDVGKPVTFTGVSATKGSWGGINADGSAAAPALLQLENVVINWGGANGPYYAAVRADQAQIRITHSQVQNSDGSGLFATINTQFNVHDTSFTANTMDAVRLANTRQSILMTGLTASGNGSDAIHLVGTLQMTGIQEWANPGIPFIVDGSVSNQAGDSLTIDAGNTLKFTSGSFLSIAGRLDAVGTADAPILLTGASQLPGSWVGLSVFGGGARAYANLEYVTVENGGSTNANIIVEDAQLVARHAVIRGSQRDGVRIYTGGNATILESQVSGNAGYGINNVNHTPFVLATNDFWGAASGPAADAGCNAGGGDKVTTGVLFKPFATAAGTAGNFPLSDAPSLTITPWRWYAPADGTTRVYFNLVLRDGNGNPIPGRVVTLTTNLGTAVTGGITDATGKALAYLTSTKIGTATVSAGLSGLNACEGVFAPQTTVTFTAPVSTVDLMPDELSPYDSQDITISPMPVTIGVPTRVSAKLTNPLNTPVTVDVSIDFAQSGIGLQFGPIKQFTGQVIPANSVVILTAPWIPEVSGHYCFQVNYSITKVGSTAVQMAPAASSTWVDPQLNLNAYQSPTGGGGKDNKLNKTRNSLKNVNRFVSATYDTGPIAVPLAVANKGISWDLDNAEKISNALEGDPPRQDFTQIALPVVQQLPPIQAGGSVSPAYAAALNDLDSTLALANSYGTAAAIAFDRAGGAAAAGDLQWQSTQTGVMLEYNRQFGQALVTAGDKIKALLEELATNEHITSVVITVSDVTAMQQKLSTSGFSAEAVADAHAVGLSDADIESLRQEIISANPADMAGDLVPAMEQIRQSFYSLGAVLQAPDTFSPALVVGGASIHPLAAGSGNRMAQVFDSTSTVQLANTTGQQETVQIAARPVDLPADWLVAVSPAQAVLAPGQAITVTVHVSPGAPVPQGIVPRVAVEASAAGQLLGGVVVDVSVPRYAPFDGKLRLYLPAIRR